MLHERGLAYQAEAEVNYDPIDDTVLANEQVDANGRSWRSGALVEKRKLKQWFFRISEMRQPLLDHLDELAKDGAWPHHVITQQKHWLGRSAGVSLKFPVISLGVDVGSAIEVFTTRPDTLFGVQYIALAASHPIVAALADSDPELQAFLDTIPGLPPDSKVGYLLPRLRAVNPLAYHEESPVAVKESLPIYVAPYVVGDYGEGAVMGVPGHDLRDHSFWRTNQADQPVRTVLALSEDESTTAIDNQPMLDPGYLTEHGGPFKGMSSAEASDMIVTILEKAGLAKPVEKWRLRDWLISRQRYWGAPIPIIHCPSCGAVPVPDDQLPVELPNVDGHWTRGRTGKALESSAAFVHCACPKCQGPARRDTDTMDTFVDSSWYYARFADPNNPSQLFSPHSGREMLPVDIYIGGVEHAILHLLYARFIFKFLAATPLLPQYSDETASSAEPFQRLIAQGMVQGKTYVEPETGRFLKASEVDASDPLAPMVIATGALATVRFEKMSKSKHNGVDPTEFIAKHGADPTRAHMLFQAPVAEVLNWDDSKMPGITRWLQRLHGLVTALVPESGDEKVPTARDYLESKWQRLDQMGAAELKSWDAEVKLWREVQKVIGTVGRSYDEIYSMNTVVSDLMGLTNHLGSSVEAGEVLRREAASAIIRLLAPITPAFAEECWEHLYPSAGSLFESAFLPKEDGSRELPMLRPRLQQCAVQINGKLRGVVDVPPPPIELEGAALGEWMLRAILDTDLGKQRFGQGKHDLSKAERAVAVKGGKVINFVMGAEATREG